MTMREEVIWIKHVGDSDMQNLLDLLDELGEPIYLRYGMSKYSQYIKERDNYAVLQYSATNQWVRAKKADKQSITVKEFLEKYSDQSTPLFEL